MEQLWSSPSQPTSAILLLWLRWQSNQLQAIPSSSSAALLSLQQTTKMFKPVQSPPSPFLSSNSIYGTPQNGTLYLGRYRIEKTIGKGSYGKVKLAYDQQEERQVALKFIARSSIKKSAHWTRIKREMNLLRVLDHRNVIRLWEVHETAQDFVLAMEYVQGKDLFDHIVGKGKLEEGEAKVIFAQLLSGLEYLHANRVVHRDLKPENVMVDANLNVKLIDFGFATLFDPKGELATNCGSPLYAAPEIVKGVKYTGPEVDAWSVGVVLYGMVTGCLPFEDENLKGLYGKICSGDYSIPDHVSVEGAALIRGLICVDARRRVTMKQALRHKWLESNGVELTTGRSSMVMPIRGGLDEQLVMQLQRDFGLGGDAHKQVLEEPGSPGRAIYDLLCAKKGEKGASAKVASAAAGGGVGGEWTLISAEEDVVLEYPSVMQQQKEQRDEEHRTRRHQSTEVNDADEYSGANFVVQAAASVMNKFRRLREYAK